MIKRHIALLVVLIFTVFAAFGQSSNAVVSEVRGKVELKSPAGDWRTAAEGMRVHLNDTISTGFNSSVVLKMGTNNVLVTALTRMTLDTYLQKEGSVNTSLYLRVGAVRAKVDDSSDLKQDFEITSPFSTASVRGTEFAFDGLNISVFTRLKGIVLLFCCLVDP